MNLNQVTLPVGDMQKSVDFYKKLGFQQIVDAPHYARFESLEGEATFSLHLADELSTNHTVIYFECEQLDRLVKNLQQKGIKFDSAPCDKEWLWREARLRDPSENTICLYWAGENRLNPPWRVTS